MENLHNLSIYWFHDIILSTFIVVNTISKLLVQTTMNIRKIAETIIKDNKYLSLATSDGKACWNAPLYYVRNDSGEFYFVSDKSSRHARHIARNPYVAVSIFNSQEKPEDVNGVQFDGLCEKVTGNELVGAITCIYKKAESALLKARFKNHKNPRSYINLTNFRIYKITPLHYYILDPKVTMEDKRVEVK